MEKANMRAYKQKFIGTTLSEGRSSRKLLKALIGGALLGHSFVACVKDKPKPVDTPVAPPPRAETIEHVIQFRGETLGAIADWYTGRAANWTVIRDSNPGLRPERLQLGDRIMIPTRIVTQEQPMPESAVKGYMRSAGRGSASSAAAVQPPAGDAPGDTSTAAQDMPGGDVQVGSPSGGSAGQPEAPADAAPPASDGEVARAITGEPEKPGDIGLQMPGPGVEPKEGEAPAAEGKKPAAAVAEPVAAPPAAEEKPAAAAGGKSATDAERERLLDELLSQ